MSVERLRALTVVTCVPMVLFSIICKDKDIGDKMLPPLVSYVHKFIDYIYLLYIYLDIYHPSLPTIFQPFFIPFISPLPHLSPMHSSFQSAISLFTSA